MADISNTHRTEADAVAEIVAKHIDPKILTVSGYTAGGPQVVAVPTGFKLESTKKFVDEYRTRPDRREGTAKLEDLDSFIAHAKRFADEGSAIFADPNFARPSLTSVLDYHPAGAESDPRFGRHRGVYTFPLSEEWAAWQAKDTEPMGQAEFAEWIENRIVDIIDPSQAGESAKALGEAIGCAFASPSKLLELSRGLALRVDVKVKSAKNLGTGESQMQYATEHQDESGAPLKVPGAFLIALAVFRNGPPYQIAARLRYRHREGSLTWFYEMHRYDRVFEHAFKEACDRAKAETALPLFMGSAE